MATHSMSIEQLYEVKNRRNSQWGIQGYDVPKKYIDPIRQVKEREYLTQKKGQPNKGPISKRGHYLEDLEKITRGVPGPLAYNLQKEWPDAKAKQTRPRSTEPKKISFIDEIFLEQKRRPVPGPGRYDADKTLEAVIKEVEEQKKKKIAAIERPSYLNEYQYMSNVNPGPGNYNPRGIQKQIKHNETTPDYWIGKHKIKKEVVKFPCVGSYQPVPVYDTFDKILIDKKVKSGNKNLWGSEDRIKDPKKSKSLQKEVPGPGHYQLIEEWNGKPDIARKEPRRQLMNRVTRGISKSIYY